MLSYIWYDHIYRRVLWYSAIVLDCGAIVQYYLLIINYLYRRAGRHACCVLYRLDYPNNSQRVYRLAMFRHTSRLHIVFNYMLLEG